MDTVITSAANGTIRRLRRLISSSKARREENTYVAEGIHLVKSFLDTAEPVQSYVIAQAAAKNAEIAELIARLTAVNTKPIVIADALFTSLFTVHPAVGIAILFTPARGNTTLNPLTERTVLLDSVQDPGNLGTILRTAAAVGIKDILLSKGCASPWSPKCLRAGMGAQFTLQVQEDVDLMAAVGQSHIPVFATTLSSDSQSLYASDLTVETAWLFGNEGQGVTAELALQATARILIPQAETSVESLNVSAAAAVCLYEQYRQMTTTSSV